MLLTLLQSQGATPPEPPSPGGGPGNRFRLLTERLPDLYDDDEAIALALVLLAA